MAVTGVNNHSNTYTNAYTSNVQRKDAKETAEKQVVEQTEAVKTGTTRKTAADELKYLSEKYKDYNFYMGTYQPSTKFGTSDKTNVMIDSQFLTKMANAPELEAEYIKEIGSMKELDEQFARGQAARGWKVVGRGWAIDKDGGISCWSITTKDPKAKSFLQKMSEKSEEIRQKQMEKAKEAKEEQEVFVMKKYKKASQKNSINLRV